MGKDQQSFRRILKKEIFQFGLFGWGNSNVSFFRHNSLYLLFLLVTLFPATPVSFKISTLNVRVDLSFCSCLYI